MCIFCRRNHKAKFCDKLQNLKYVKKLCLKGGAVLFVRKKDIVLNSVEIQ